jgi:DNA-binding transcriptional LysR family regulator
MDTVWLEDFLALVAERNFSRAAERRNVSQPAFSRRIQGLEDWVDTRLFDRSTHTIRLTAAGECFSACAEETLRGLQVGREAAMAAAQNAKDTLRFAATHVLSLTMFPRLMRELEARAPTTATVQLTADHMAACEQLMVDGRSQFLLCHHHPAASTRLTPDRFQSAHLGWDRLLPVATPELSATPRPQLVYTAESGMGRILTAAWAKAGQAQPKDPVFASHLANVLTAMARDGRGVAWAPESLVAQDVEAGRLVVLIDEGEPIPLEIRVFRLRARLSPSAETLWTRICGLGAEWGGA